MMAKYPVFHADRIDCGALFRLRPYHNRIGQDHERPNPERRPGTEPTDERGRQIRRRPKFRLCVRAHPHDAALAVAGQQK
jgi:hypothetical protein